MLMGLMGLFSRREILALFTLWAGAPVPPGGAGTLAWPLPPATHSTYLPLVMRGQSRPFGVQPGRGQLAKAIMVDRAKNLGVQWTRLDMGFWRNIQPTRGAPYNVAELDRFEHDLAGALAANLTPISVVIDNPAWATINRPYPTSCRAIRADRFSHFAAFM